MVKFKPIFHFQSLVRIASTSIATSRPVLRTLPILAKYCDIPLGVSSEVAYQSVAPAESGLYTVKSKSLDVLLKKSKEKLKRLNRRPSNAISNEPEVSHFKFLLGIWIL